MITRLLGLLREAILKAGKILHVDSMICNDTPLARVSDPQQ